MMRARSAELFLHFVTRVLIGAGAVTVTVAAVVMIRGFVGARTATSDSAEIRSVERDLKQDKPAGPAPAAPVDAPKSYAVIGVLESALKKDADSKKCQLTEFKAEPETTNYISLYRREAPDAGWKQSVVHFSVDGPLADVVETIRGIETSKVPVEIDSIGMSRLKVEKGGKARITAQVQLRALWKDG